jgi:hypothetical protein
LWDKLLKLRRYLQREHKKAKARIDLAAWTSQKKSSKGGAVSKSFILAGLSACGINTDYSTTANANRVKSKYYWFDVACCDQKTWDLMVKINTDNNNARFAKYKVKQAKNKKKGIRTAAFKPQSFINSTHVTAMFRSYVAAENRYRLLQEVDQNKMSPGQVVDRLKQEHKAGLFLLSIYEKYGGNSISDLKKVFGSGFTFQRLVQACKNLMPSNWKKSHGFPDALWEYIKTLETDLLWRKEVQLHSTEADKSSANKKRVNNNNKLTVSLYCSVKTLNEDDTKEYYAQLRKQNKQLPKRRPRFLSLFDSEDFFIYHLYNKTLADVTIAGGKLVDALNTYGFECPMQITYFHADVPYGFNTAEWDKRAFGLNEFKNMIANMKGHDIT